MNNTFSLIANISAGVLRLRVRRAFNRQLDRLGVL